MRYVTRALRASCADTSESVTGHELAVLSLFSGIGGLELGFERAGLTVVGQVEFDDVCRSVLAHHWPEVPQHDDVRTAVGWWRGAVRPRVDVVCGGFPCQPFSQAGRRHGVADDRWMWPAFADVVRAVGPRYVVVENVAALLRDTEAWGWVLGDLADLGFDAEWSVLPACAVGAPHTRERVFLVAYADVQHGPARVGTVAERRGGRPVPGEHGPAGAWPDPVDGVLAASIESDRVPNGLAVRLVAAAGNAAVPQVAEVIGRMIVAHDEARREVAA